MRLVEDLLDHFHSPGLLGKDLKMCKPKNWFAISNQTSTEFSSLSKTLVYRL